MDRVESEPLEARQSAERRDPLGVEPAGQVEALDRAERGRLPERVHRRARQFSAPELEVLELGRESERREVGRRGPRPSAQVEPDERRQLGERARRLRVEGATLELDERELVEGRERLERRAEG